MRGPIAVHAAKKYLPEFVGPRSVHPEFTGPLRRAGITDVPLGCVVATATLVACVAVAAEPYAVELVDAGGRVVETLVIPPPAPERTFGDYRVGRWCWVLRDVVRLARPVPVVGSQGWFDVPDYLIAAGRIP